MARVCVFCSSSELPASQHELARELGGAIARRGDELVYGGTTTGLMGAVASGARDAGGRVVGIVPESMAGTWLVDDALDELVIVPTMGARKDEMMRDTPVFVVLAGGLGTLDELLEVLTHRQLGMLPPSTDIVLLDPDGFWAPLHALLDALVAGGTARPEVAHVRTARTVAEALAIPDSTP